MDGPDPKETKGVPWGDHNETEPSPEDTRREEYSGSESDADRRPEESGDYGSGATERPTDEDRGDVEHDL